MKKLRWAMDGGFWELDVSTPLTLEGEARAVPGDPLPLGLCRGTKLSRTKQLHFFQRFMAFPFVPSYSPSTHGHGFSFQSVLPIPTFSQNWFGTLLGQFNLQKFLSSLNESYNLQSSSLSSRLQTICRHLRDKSLYAVGFCSELSFTPDDTLLFSFDTYGDNRSTRKKAVFHHKFPNHTLTVEAVSPGLFSDNSGNYWDVPFSMAIDLASVAPSDSAPSFHLCVHHNSGSPKPFQSDQTLAVPAALLPGSSVKSAFSFKKSIDIWRSKAQKLKMVQPYDLFLSNPHISASGIIGATVTTYIGDNSVRSQEVDDSLGFKGLCIRAPEVKSAFFGDIFSSIAFTAQYGNFQRPFLDLTRFHVCLDFPSGSKFLSGTAKVAQDFFNSQQPSMETVKAICPNALLSFQQQIAGPFSLRVDSGVVIDWKKKDWLIRVRDPVFALEYALQVLGSAKAIAWYSPKQKEFMVELRFFET